MEDDVEIHPQSHSPPSNRITVTVAASAAAAAHPQNSLTLALPIQTSPPSRPSTASAGRDDCWSDGATAVLIEAWGERYVELSRGNLKQKHWKEVADIVNSRDDHKKPPKTDIQCKNRIDTVKKKYKIEKSKVSAGCGPSRWSFFDRFDRLIGSVSDGQKVVPVGIPVGVSVRPFPLTPVQPHLHSQEIRPNNFPSPVIQPFNFNAAPKSNMDLLRSFSNQTPQQYPRGPPVPEVESEEELSPDSEESLPPERNSGGGLRKKKKRRKKEKGMKIWGNSVRELTRAILKFGEAYEAAESVKLEQIVEMEKQRMKFAMDLELQRLKFLMNSHLELSQLNTIEINSRIIINNHSNDIDSRSGGSGGRRGGSGGGGSRGGKSS